MDFRLLNFRGLVVCGVALVLVSCATSTPVVVVAKEDGSDASDEVYRSEPKPEPEPERLVGSVAVVNSSVRGRGFILVRPVSKRTKVDVGETLEARNAQGLKTAMMIRSAEDNRRFFVADIREGMPSEGDSVVVLAKAPELRKAASGLPSGRGLLEDLDLEAPLSLPPLSEADIKAMEP